MESRVRRADNIISIGLPFIAAVAIVIALLKILALVPAQIETIGNWVAPDHGFDSRMASVASIEEAESALGRAVWVPIYFPDYLIWPPSSITVQRYPEKNLALVFRYSDQREALVLRQFLLNNDDNRAGTVPPPAVVSRTSHVAIGESEGVLVEGYNSEGSTRNVLYWSAQDRFVVMAGELPALELLRMAHSLRSLPRSPHPGSPRTEREMTDLLQLSER